MLQPAATALADALGQFQPGRPDIACRIDEFVVSGDRAATRIEQRLLGPRRAVAGQQVVDVVRQPRSRQKRPSGTACGTNHYDSENGRR